MAPSTTFSFLTTALLLSASAVNGLAIRQPLDVTSGRHQPYVTTERNHEPYDITIVTTDSHRQPLSTSKLSSTHNSVQVCITVGDNPDGTKHQICAENPDDLCYDPVWKAVPRPANILPWCAEEGTSTELKVKRLAQGKIQNKPPGSAPQRGFVERGNAPSGSIPGGKIP